LKIEPVVITLPTASGLPHDVYRCPNCQIALWSDYGRRGVLSFLRVGTLDAPHVFVPDVHIYTRSKVPWLELPANVPAFEEYYDLE
ncbi:GFA family protein, partial [Rhodoplanes roseus]